MLNGCRACQRLLLAAVPLHGNMQRIHTVLQALEPWVALCHGGTVRLLRKHRSALHCGIASMRWCPPCFLQLFASLKQQLAAAEEATSRKTTELATQLKRAQDYIGQLMAERKQINNKFHDMKTDLLQRAQAACAQRDEARGRVGNGAYACVSRTPPRHDSCPCLHREHWPLCKSISLSLLGTGPATVRTAV